MTREQFPISPESLPEEARQYLGVVQAHQDDPFVKGCFHQVTILNLIVPNHGPVTFFALEFRDGLSCVLAWQDGEGHWGAGRWVRIAHADDEITCPPSPVSIEYFQGNRALPSFRAVIDELAATRPASRTGPLGTMPLDDAVRTAVRILQSQVHLDDEEVVRAIVEQGVHASQATRLVQFIPIAFCRFVFRGSGVQFAENYVVLGPDGQPADELPLRDEPVFREAMAQCEAAAAAGQRAPYFLPVAARSAGFKAIQDLLQRGSRPENILTSPPLICD